MTNSRICIWDAPVRASLLIKELRNNGVDASHYEESRPFTEQTDSQTIFCIGLSDKAGSLEERLKIVDHRLIKKERTLIYAETITEERRLNILESGFENAVLTQNLTSEIRALLARENGNLILTTNQDKSMVMHISENELANVIQFLAFGERKGELHISFEAKRTSGRIFFNGTTASHASYGEHIGLQAIAIMLRSGDSEAHFHPDRDAPVQSLHLPVDALLLNASVFADEELEPSE